MGLLRFAVDLKTLNLPYKHRTNKLYSDMYVLKNLKRSTKNKIKKNKEKQKNIDYLYVQWLTILEYIKFLKAIYIQL